MAHDMRKVAAARWMEASSFREKIQQKIEELQSIEPKVSVNYTARLEQIETLMQQYRLHSVAAIFADFSYAQKQDIETVLWSTHTMFNNTYRKVLSRIGDRSQVVQKRKVDKLYRDFLKYSQLFYKGYVQRLAGSYDIPELKQAAYGLEVEPQSAVQISGDLPAATRAALVNACYMTLVRLGDLARYRCQHAEKATKGSFDTALTYYGLASILDPDDGTCHHQMAVLHQIQGQQLEIIYRFHRSISIAKPYPLGPGNLQKAFDRHQNQSNSRRGAAKDPAEAIVSWFVKLHAHYAKGKKFSVQRELEDEVLHQLEMSLKGEGNEDVVLKMILINIAAYDIAKENLNDPDKWSMEGSQTCQYILNFNLRTIQVLVRQLLTALQNDTGITLASNQDGSAECTVEFSASLSKLTSLCRICLAWLYVTRSDLNAYQDHLDQKAREDVHRLLAEVLTRLLPHALVNCLVAQSKYLLPEDTEIIGLRPLADEQLPLFIDDKITGNTGSTYCRKALKPQKEATRPHFRPHTETLWRIRDILLCGIYLAASHESPLIMTGGPNGTRVWVYPDDPAKGLGDAQDQRGQSIRPLGETELSTLFEDLTMASAQHTDNAPAATTAQGSLEDLLSPPALPANTPVGKGVLTSKPNGVAAKATPKKAQAKASARQSEVEELDMDQMVNDMVDDLTGNGDENDDSLLQPSSALADNTSYGMNSSTANDIFGQLGLGPSHSLSPDHGPNPRAAPSVSPTGASLTNSIPIPSHPWGYSLSASTAAPDSSLHSLGNGRDVPRTITSPTPALGGSVGGFEQMISPTYGSYGRAEGLGAANPATSGFTSGLGSLPGNIRISPTAYGHMEVGSIGASTRTDSPDFANAQRNLARDRLASDLFAQYGVSSAKNRPSPGLSPASASGIFRSGPSPLPAVRRTGSMSPGMAENMHLLEALKSGQARDKANEQLLAQLGGLPTGVGRQQQPRRSGPIDVNNHGGQRQPGYTSPLAGGYPNQFTPSPRAIGSPHHRSQGSMGSFEGQLSSLNYGENSVGRVGSPWTFSHPSQIWTDTPATVAQPAQLGMVESNGNYYNGSTAFGRSGEGNNRDDPTHFRNKVKQFGGVEKATAYDRAILESALADTHNKPSRK